VDTVRDTLAIFAEMIAAARLREDRARAAASDPLLLATDLADRLVEGGVPFRQAHEIIGRLVGRAQELGVPLDKLDPSEFLAASPILTPEIVSANFDLEAALSARRATGAPSPGNVAREIARWTSQLG
jgi:argininosuccinate lyase